MKMAEAMKWGKRRRLQFVKVNPILSHFPDDAIVEILSGLPVKDVLRFRCVCKSWNSMVSDPQFAKSHRCKRTCLFVINKNHLVKVGYLEELENIDDYGLIPNPYTTVYPSYVPIPGFLAGRYWDPPPRYLGSCNGLMCLLTTYGALIVWNPCTGKFKNLPKISVRGFKFFWFGYDKCVDDYKLVVVSVSPEVHVLTLKSNSWRKLITKDVKFGRGRMYGYKATARGTLLAGNVHWLVRGNEESGSCIAAFDLSAEQFQKLSKPDLDPHKVCQIGVLGGCLYLCSSFFDSHGRSWFELWIMKEYGIVSSWKKLATVSDWVLDDEFTPLYYAKEDEIVALIYNRIAGKAWIGRLNITDLSLHKTLVATGLSSSWLAYQSIVHMESLVSVDAEEHG